MLETYWEGSVYSGRQFLMTLSFGCLSPSSALAAPDSDARPRANACQPKLQLSMRATLQSALLQGPSKYPSLQPEYTVLGTL